MSEMGTSVGLYLITGPDVNCVLDILEGPMNSFYANSNSERFIYGYQPLCATDESKDIKVRLLIQGHITSTRR